MFKWKKLGKVFDPTRAKTNEWMREYAQCPTPMVLNDSILRVFIASRPKPTADLQYVSYTGFVDLDRRRPTEVINISSQPVIGLGKPGTFDEFGVMPGTVVRRGAELFLYYTGWTRMSSVPYVVGIGLAISRNDGESFERIGEGPILGLTLNEPYLVNSPAVLFANGCWHMWYLSGKGWLIHNGKPEAVFQIAHATSDDGVKWNRNGVPIISAYSDDECQDIFMPFFKNNRWHALFGFRRATGFRSDPSRAYRLGYASSTDLMNWERNDSHAGITVSEKGWDSMMISSSQVIELDGRLLLFYCGNQFGREGFGIAEADA